MARWYIVDGANHPTLTLDAPDRPTAEAMAHELGQGVGVISVCEYEVIQEEIRTAAKKAARAQAIVERAVRMDYALRESDTGQREAFGSPDVERDIKAMAWARGELEAHLKGEVVA